MRLGSWPIYGAIAIFAAVVALYFPTLLGGFVYDSIAQVLHSDYIHTSSNWGDVLTLRVVGQDELDRNRPLHLTSLMFDAAIWGKNPFGYRLTSVVLHALNASLLFAFLTIALQRRTSSVAEVSPVTIIPFFTAFGALLFALHPLVVEAVAEPSNREDLLVLLPMLIGLLAIVLPTRSPRALNAALVLCSFFAVLAKESGIAIPFVFAVAAWLFGNSRRCLPGLIGGVVAVGLFLTASYLLRPEASGIFTRAPAALAPDVWLLLATQLRIWALQLSQIVWPWNLSAHYPAQALADFTVPISIVMIGGTAVAAFLLLRANRLAALGVAIFVFGLLPASNFVPQYHPIADRYLYVPLAGFGMILAAMAYRLWMCYSTRLAGYLILSAALAVLAAEYAANLRRQIVWQQPAALWSDVLRQYPDLSQALIGMANVHYRAGAFEAARAAATKAVVSSGGVWADAWALRAICEWQTGAREAATESLRQAKKLSRVYSDEGSVAEAMFFSPAQLTVFSEISAAMR